MTEPSLKALLLLKKGHDVQVGASRVALLRRIAATRSIAAAAKAEGLSYKAAWDAVQALNNLSAQPLVLAKTGGRKGGKTVVTPAGQALIAAYGKIDDLLSGYMDAVQAVLDAEAVGLDDLLRSLTMKTSARNAWHGVVTEVKDGAVNAEVHLRIADDIDLVAIVTQQSVADLGLALGRTALALIKSSFVILAAGHDPLPVSARNRLKGTIVAITPGAVNDEVVLQLDAGKTLTAVVTHESVEELHLAVGQPAQGLIKASHIILATD